MSADEIRAQAIEVLARAEWDAWKVSFDLFAGGDGPFAPAYDDAPADHTIKLGVLRIAERAVDALAAAGLLPTEAEQHIIHGFGARVISTRRRYVTDWQEVGEWTS